MNKRDYLAFVVISLLFIIIFGAQFGLFSSNIKQEGLQKNLNALGSLILEKVNQTAILIHEDGERQKQNELNIAIARNQSIFESKGRDNQTQIHVNATKAGVIQINHTMDNFFTKYNNTTEKMFSQINNIVKDIDFATNQNTNISKELLLISDKYQQLAKDHDKIQIEVQNTTNKIDNQTNATYNMLKYYGDINTKFAINNNELNKNTNKVVNDINDTMSKILLYLTKGENTTNYLEDED